VVNDPLSVTPLSEGELPKRARRLKLVLTDCDGVLTDAGVYYSVRGEELKRFSLRDGMGVERLRDAGIETAIVTRESAEFAARRAEKLKIKAHLGIRDKGAALSEILAQHGVSPDEVGYIGDDVNDLSCIERVREVGLCAAPADAMPEVARRTHYVTTARAGHGAFREFAEWILAGRSAGVMDR
jgi:3-deoxy-D-manno-octulosonate 8-phosphate phosphatase (KDO 8-P phosphatase)